jgi:hypothetical protein
MLFLFKNTISNKIPKSICTLSQNLLFHKKRKPGTDAPETKLSEVSVSGAW